MHPLLCLLLCFSVSAATPPGPAKTAEAAKSLSENRRLPLAPTPLPQGEKVFRIPTEPQAQDVGPLRALTSVARSGRLLQLDYLLVDAAGRRFRDQRPGKPPEFIVSRNGHQLGSGSFEYG